MSVGVPTRQCGAAVACVASGGRCRECCVFSTLSLFFLSPLFVYVQTLVSVKNPALTAAVLEFVSSPDRPDWPGRGAIDLKVQDLPHCTAATEWWYYNMHFTCAGMSVLLCVWGCGRCGCGGHAVEMLCRTCLFDASV